MKPNLRKLRKQVKNEDWKMKDNYYIRNLESKEYFRGIKLHESSFFTKVKKDAKILEGPFITLHILRHEYNYKVIPELTKN